MKIIEVGKQRANDRQTQNLKAKRDSETKYLSQFSLDDVAPSVRIACAQSCWLSSSSRKVSEMVAKYLTKLFRPNAKTQSTNRTNPPVLDCSFSFLLVFRFSRFVLFCSVNEIQRRLMDYLEIGCRQKWLWLLKTHNSFAFDSHFLWPTVWLLMHLINS